MVSEGLEEDWLIERLKLWEVWESPAGRKLSLGLEDLPEISCFRGSESGLTWTQGLWWRGGSIPRRELEPQDQNSLRDQ